MVTTGDMSLILRTLRYAAENHRNQRRKDSGRTPYINHLIEVAETLWEIGGVHDPRTIAAALLHDLVEDTDRTPADIERTFGGDIASIVVELTDDMSLPVNERREYQVAHAEALSIPAAQVKLADKISNLAGLIESPPAAWSTADILAYAEWGRRVVERLRGINPRLDAHFDTVYANVAKAYGGSVDSTGKESRP